MVDITALPDEARVAFDNLKDLIRKGPTGTVRLGVTGLSRSGKTVFITALVHNLINGGRLPLFDSYAQGRLISAKLNPQPDDTVPRFEYEKHVSDLVSERVWPQSTRRISELRISIEYESAIGWRRTLGRGRLHVDIIDYPGEWLLDLALLKKSYVTWSTEALAASHQPHREQLAREWRANIDGIDPDDIANEQVVQRASRAFTSYLRAARDDRLALSMLPPGRFLMPGDLEGSPALTFSPLQMEPNRSPRKGSIGELMAHRYDAYRSHVVKPFFREHFSRLDRQIVLVDPLAALNAGPGALADLKTALGEILAAFRPGRRSWLSSILSRQIDRVLFAATKADHVHSSDHDKLAGLLAKLVKQAAETAQIKGATAKVMALSAVRATREATVSKSNLEYPALVGTPLPDQSINGRTYDGETEIALFPGELPTDFDFPTESVQGLDAPKNAGWESELQYFRFKPPELEKTANPRTLSLPHIRLDQALEYLIGDKLR